MRSGRTKIATSLLCFCMACTVPQLLADKKDQAGSGADDQRRALHALSRLTFGPRPGDVQQVMAMGVERWIAWQLHPEKIDDSALNARLEPLRTLRLSAREIAEDFPDGQEINQVRNGKKPMPSDAARRAVFQVQMARQEEKKERKEVAAKNAAADTVPVILVALSQWVARVAEVTVLSHSSAVTVSPTGNFVAVTLSM